jgi:site-specific DNA recombinase
MTKVKKTAKTVPQVRCAIYTRKSTEDGLEQEFNSLDAQMPRCPAGVWRGVHQKPVT